MNKSLLLFVSIILFTKCDTAFERNLSGRKVTLLAPVNNLVTTDTLQTFYWEYLDGAAKYQLQIVSPRFDSIARLIADTIITRNTLLIDLNINSYQWRVKGINNSSSTDQNEIRNLRIQ